MNQPALDPLEMAERLAAGRLDWHIAGWLFAGFRKFLRDRGTVPLGRCLGLDLSPAQLRMRQRNRWICEAAAWVVGDTPRQRALALAEAYECFVTRGGWAQWKGLDAPPADASRLRAALFRAAISDCDGAGVVSPLSYKQMERIAGHVLSRKCPLRGFTIDP